MPNFHVRIANDDLVFSAGHFITLGGGRCERLHGHTYRVAAEVSGPAHCSTYWLCNANSGPKSPLSASLRALR